MNKKRRDHNRSSRRGSEAAAPEMPRFEHKKSLGQNFLNSDVVPRWMCDAADINPVDVVLEIGPGEGALTHELLTRGAQVIAIEADERALTILRERFASAIEAGQLTLHHTDARDIDPTELGLSDHAYKVVANIPYYLSGFLFRQLLTGTHQPTTLVFLIQKEVAERIARDTKSSLLSISVRVYGEPRYVRTVSKGHFTPSPKIDSGIIAVTDISKRHFATLTEADFFAILRAGFAQKRKQLLGNLSRLYDRATIQHALTALDLPATIRAENLSTEQWLALATTLLTADQTKPGDPTED